MPLNRIVLTFSWNFCPYALDKNYRQVLISFAKTGNANCVPNKKMIKNMGFENDKKPLSPGDLKALMVEVLMAVHSLSEVLPVLWISSVGLPSITAPIPSIGIVVLNTGLKLIIPAFQAGAFKSSIIIPANPNLISAKPHCSLLKLPWFGSVKLVALALEPQAPVALRTCHAMAKLV